MKNMKNFFKNLSVKQIVIVAAIFFSLLCFGGLTVFASVSKKGLADQDIAARWSAEGGAAQISCFFTEAVEVDKNSVRNFENQLDTALQEASIVPPNENARLWSDAYSALGKVTLNSGKVSLEANAIGIGGDFFQFHPVQLLSGTYFSGNDLMYDKVIIDEDAAWQLFGSNDVTGMEVRIGGIPHYISGVIRREAGRFEEAAGLDKTLVYLSYESLEAYGVTEGINTYEIVMPNPVSGFAYSKVKEKFGIDENGMWVVDNTARFSLKQLFTVISEFGIRSMNNHAIHYPYWENVARGWEDVLAVVLVLQLICLFIPSVIIVASVIILWRGRQWTGRDVLRALQRSKEGIADRLRSEKNKWKHF